MGDRVFEARQALQQSQEVFAEHCGLKRLHVLAIEEGRNKLTTIEPRRKLAKGFGVAVETLEAYLDGRINLKAFLAQRGGGHRLNELQLRVIDERSVALGAHNDLVVNLVSETATGAEMQTLPVAMRKAVIGFVHVYDAPIDKAVVLAKQLVEKYGRNEDPPFWFERLAARWKELPESGMRFTPPQIKIDSAEDL
jgi:transcriptional regulator with XRE-family HTH domain